MLHQAVAKEKEPAPKEEKDEDTQGFLGSFNQKLDQNSKKDD